MPSRKRPGNVTPHQLQRRITRVRYLLKIYNAFYKHRMAIQQRRQTLSDKCTEQYGTGSSIMLDNSVLGRLDSWHAGPPVEELFHSSSASTSDTEDTDSSSTASSDSSLTSVSSGSSDSTSDDLRLNSDDSDSSSSRQSSVASPFPPFFSLHKNLGAQGFVVFSEALDSEDDDVESSDDEYGIAFKLHNQQNQLRKWVTGEITHMYSRRYEQPRHSQLRPKATFLQHVLHVYKIHRPDHFRQELRVSPSTFNLLVQKLETDLIFSNDANTPQMPVEQQLAITLWRFGHDGNASGLQKVANWAGIGKGTVSLVTRRVMTAILRSSFMKKVVKLPTEDEKEDAKQWVEENSCSDWRNGWLMVDGTLVPLFSKPKWFGESYFDRKCNYSLNVQVVSLPNLDIVDFGIGHVGSTHDSSAWEGTYIAKKHEEVLRDDEWIWADSAYPISSWVVAPYKKPERDIPDNEQFNTAVSRIRIRSEHTIGFLKGRFQSLKGLRININSRVRHVFATYWVAACIVIHSFALKAEAQERLNDDNLEPLDTHPFLQEQSMSDASDDEPEQDPGVIGGTTNPQNQRLRAGKQHREKLKNSYFQALERRQRQRHRWRRGQVIGED